MKIFVYFIGKPRDPHANALAADYLKRISRYASAASQEVRPDRHEFLDRHASAQKIFLDPEGRSFGSAAFAQLIAAAEMIGRDLVFLVGGHEGLTASMKARADLLLSLSPMVFPHELARVMLLEQIYRGFAILQNHPYPR